jgi:hypothetical protein
MFYETITNRVNAGDVLAFAFPLLYHIPECLMAFLISSSNNLDDKTVGLFATSPRKELIDWSVTVSGTR